VARVGIQVAEALAYAHGQRVLHRDIKPSNLLLDTRGNVWVADFGLAKTSDGEDLTYVGDVVGTLRYMAPERFGGHSDERADVYSLGLTLYELVALRPGFDESDRHKLILQVTQAEPPRLRKVVPVVPRDLETIIHKAMAREPGHRYASAGAMAEDLRRYVEDKPIRARRIGAAERLWRWCRRNPAVAGLTAAVVLLFLAGFAGVTWNWRAAKSARDEARKAVAKAEAVNHFLVRDLLAEAAPEKTKGHAVTVEELLHRADRKVATAFLDQPEVESSVRLVLGDTYASLGLYREAEAHLRRALDLHRRVLGPEHPDTLGTLVKLCDCLVPQNKWSEPGLDRRAIVETCRRVLGPEHPKTLRAMNNLAWTLRAHGQFSQAGMLKLQIVAAYRRILGPEHPDSLRDVSTLVYFVSDRNQLSEVETLLRHAVDAQRRMLGSEHPATLGTVVDLAVILVKRDKWPDAEVLLQPALDASRRVLGPGHARTLEMFHVLNVVLRRQGKLLEAEAFARQALDESNHVQANGSRWRVGAMEDLAWVLSDLGRRTEAESLLRDVLRIQREVDPPDHPNIANLLTSLGFLLLQGNDAEQAEPLFREALRIIRRALPAGDPVVTAAARVGLGAALMENGHAREAEPHLREGLEIYRKVVPFKLEVTTAYVENLLGGCLVALGRHAEAEPLLLGSYARLGVDRGVLPVRARLARERIIRLYETWGQPGKAAEWRAERPQAPTPDDGGWTP
jgi:tetratricopeptide (TPR) repeat protein